MTRITQARLHELFDYSVVAGRLYSKVKRGPRGVIPAGSLVPCSRLYHKNGRPKYSQLEVDGEKWYHHRLVWYWVTGLLPENVDHENRDICCNAWHNLRDATVSENGCNRTKQANNKSGYKGVCFNKSKGLWQAQIRKNGVVYNLGRFATPELARDVYNAKCVELHGSFAKHD